MNLKRENCNIPDTFGEIKTYEILQLNLGKDCGKEVCWKEKNILLTLFYKDVRGAPSAGKEAVLNFNDMQLECNFDATSIKT